MEYLFCFKNEFSAAAATFERKKIERGIQVVAKWDANGSPTITYESRFDFDGGANYRVKYNASVWASFDQDDAKLVAEFRQALSELSVARHKSEYEEAQSTNKENNTAAAKFFRGESLPY